MLMCFISPQITLDKVMLYKYGIATLLQTKSTVAHFNVPSCTDEEFFFGQYCLLL